MIYEVSFKVKVNSRHPEWAIQTALQRVLKGRVDGVTLDFKKNEKHLIYKLDDLAVCDDCGHVFQIDADNDFATIPSLNERIEPGGMVPICECPECGALAYPLFKFESEGKP